MPCNRTILPFFLVAFTAFPSSGHRSSAKSGPSTRGAALVQSVELKRVVHGLVLRETEADHAEREAAERRWESFQQQEKLITSAIQADKSGVTPLWTAFSAAIPTDAVSSWRNKFVVSFISCMVAFVALAAACLPYYEPGWCCAVQKEEPDWDANHGKFLSPEHTTAAIPSAYQCNYLNIAQLQISRSDPELSPRAESFASCQDHSVASGLARSDGGEFSPRSFASFADDDVNESMLSNRPPSRADSESHGAEVQRDWAAGSYDSFAERALTGPIIR